MNAVPNESWELILQFHPAEYRIFKAGVARVEKGYAFLAYPNLFKTFSFDSDGVVWKTGQGLSSDYLYEHSVPISPQNLARQCLNLGSQNRAPTAQHRTHHVYGVTLQPFNAEFPFSIGESIGGGHAEMGGAMSYSLSGLLAFEGWKKHFQLSGCAWAIPIIEADTDWENKLSVLIEQAKACNGMSTT